MIIPKSFQLLGHTFTVAMQDNLQSGHDAIGLAKFHENKIILQAHTKATPHARTQIEQTFCHEVVHCILDAMGDKERSENEQFVDLFGSLIHQVLTTQRGQL
jgi:hypothetical protein